MSKKKKLPPMIAVVNKFIPPPECGLIELKSLDAFLELFDGEQFIYHYVKENSFFLLTGNNIICIKKTTKEKLIAKLKKKYKIVKYK